MVFLSMAFLLKTCITQWFYYNHKSISLASSVGLPQRNSILDTRFDQYDPFINVILLINLIILIYFLIASGGVAQSVRRTICGVKINSKSG